MSAKFMRLFLFGNSEYLTYPHYTDGAVAA